LSPGGSGYFTCTQNMKLVTNKFKSGGLHEKHVVATWNVGKHLSICLLTQGNQENLCRGGRSQDLPKDRRTQVPEFKNCRDYECVEVNTHFPIRL